MLLGFLILTVACTDTAEKPTSPIQPLNAAGPPPPPAEEDEGDPPPEGVFLSAQEESFLVTEALSRPDAQALIDSLNSFGYSLLAQYAVGVRKTNQPKLGATVLIIPFGTSTDSTRAAFIDYAKWDSSWSLGVVFHALQNDSPTTANYERLTPGLWQLQSATGTSTQSETGASAFASIPYAGWRNNAFHKCFVACVAGASTGCALGCLPFGPAYPECFAACEAGAIVGCFVGCAVQSLLDEL